MFRLSRELSVLDGDNIHSMMASEEAVDNLMLLLTSSIQEVEVLESRLNQYDEFLEHIRSVQIYKKQGHIFFQKSAPPPKKKKTIIPPEVRCGCAARKLVLFKKWKI